MQSINLDYMPVFYLQSVDTVGRVAYSNEADMQPRAPSLQVPMFFIYVHHNEQYRFMRAEKDCYFQWFALSQLKHVP